jgi:hypothetical protein
MTTTEHNKELDGLAAMAHAQYAAVLRDTPFGPPLPYADLPHIHREAWRAGAGAVARASTVGHDLVRDFAGPRPEIVVLCGSTRFYDTFQQANYDLTMAGAIVLSVGFYPHSKALHGHGEGVGHDSAEKIALDELHMRKIDLADRVLVLNVDGYIGESTRREIAYAQAAGKPISYLLEVGR